MWHFFDFCCWEMQNCPFKSCLDMLIFILLNMFLCIKHFGPVNYQIELIKYKNPLISLQSILRIFFRILQKACEYFRHITGAPVLPSVQCKTERNLLISGKLMQRGTCSVVYKANGWAVTRLPLAHFRWNGKKSLKAYSHRPKEGAKMKILFDVCRFFLTEKPLALWIALLVGST